MVEFSQEIFDTICERLANGESLRKICLDDDMPDRSNVFRWIAVDEALRDQYARARAFQADAKADDVSWYSEQAAQGLIDPGAARVAIDGAKWTAGKLNPKVYGDKVAIGGAEDLGPLVVKWQSADD